MMRRKIDQTDYSGRVAATKLRLARERLGIPKMEAELQRMRQINWTSKVSGSGEVFTDEEIEDVRIRLLDLESQARSTAG